MRAEFLLDYDVLTVEQPHKLYLMARFVSGPAPGDGKRRPLNLSLVIDRSGSMAGNKIDYTRQAAQFLVQHLGTHDTFSIVLYNDKIETLLPPERIDNKDAVVQLLEKIRVRGTTNLSGGWLEGCKHVAANLSGDTLNRVLLMSDGLANRGVKDTQQLVALARQKYEEGVSTTTMGLGNDFNEELMGDIAHSGGGAFYFIESPEVAPTIFQEELRGLLNVVGQNLTITLVPTQHVTGLKQLNAYPMSENGQTTSFRLGDIFGDEFKSLMLELSIPALSELGELQIATLRFEYDEIVGEHTEHRTNEIPVIINIKPQGSELPDPDAHVARQVLLLKSAQARQKAVKAADKGEYETASEVLRTMVEEIEQAAVDDQELSEEREALQKQADNMEKGEHDVYSRKTMYTQSIYTLTNRHEDTRSLRMREQTRQYGGESLEIPVKQSKQKATQAPTRRDSLPKNTHDTHIDQKIQAQPGVTPTHVTWQDQTFAIEGDLVRMGRAVHNEIIINERGVSRFHCHIVRKDAQLILEDLNSTNGTRIRGNWLQDPHTLSVGDVVHLCDAKLVFHLADAAGADKKDGQDASTTGEET